MSKHKSGRTEDKEMVVCRLCRNYYITHDPAHPYGCRALGFKSKKTPALVVFESSGIQCQLFLPKNK